MHIRRNQEELIIRYLYNSGSLTASQAAEVIERSIPAARKRLNQLIDKGIIVVHGSSPHDPKRFYTLNEK